MLIVARQMVKRAIFIHRKTKRKKRKGVHSKNNKPDKKYRGQGRWKKIIKCLDSVAVVSEWV